MTDGTVAYACTFAATLAASLSGTHATYWLCHRTRLGPIRSSTLPSLAFVAVSSLISSPLVPLLRTAFFGATFVGMSEGSRLGERGVLFAAIVFSALFSVLEHFHLGIGGSLGTAAFLSCLLAHSLGRLWRGSDRIDQDTSG